MHIKRSFFTIGSDSAPSGFVAMVVIVAMAAFVVCVVNSLAIAYVVCKAKQM